MFVFLFSILWQFMPVKMTSPIHSKPPCGIHYDQGLKVLWSTPLRQDSSGGSSMHPVIYDDLVLYSSLYFDRPNTLLAFDPER